MHIAHTLTHSHTLTHIAHTYTYMYVPHTHIHMCTHTHTHTHTHSTQALLVNSRQFLLDVYQDFVVVWPALLM